MIFITPFKSGSTSLGKACQILGYKNYGWNENIFNKKQYILINHLNKIVGSLQTIDYESKAIQDIQKVLNFVRISALNTGANCFNEFPFGHECFDPFLKKIIFPEGKLIYSVRSPKKNLYDSTRHNFNTPNLSDEYFDMCFGAMQSRYRVLQKQFTKDVLFYRLGSGWKPLCNFLGKPIPTVDFPHLNKRKQG